jgi:hypothetical protein
MAGLVPAIHVLVTIQEDVDARHKAGHDEIEIADWVDCPNLPRIRIAT